MDSWGKLFAGLVLAYEWVFPVHEPGLGLGSPIEMLGPALVRELLPGPLSFSEEEYFFLSEYDRRAGLEPQVLGGYLAIPPTRVIALSHPGIMAKLITHISPWAVLKTFTR